MTPPPDQSLNLYGDRVVPTTGRHGVDVGSQRIDELDRLCLARALADAPPPAAVDIGCGLGVHGFRLALLGCSVVLNDIVDLTARAHEFVRLFPHARVRVVTRDARALDRADLSEPPGIVYAQRVLHYLPFDDAVAVLRRLGTLSQPGAHFYLSVSGLDSELGVGYPAAAAPVRERFAPLALDMARKHDIREPVCLYTEAEFVSLGEHAGLACERVFSSPFGNKKGVFRAPGS